MGRLEPKVAGHLILHLFDLGRKELNYLTAFRTDHVIVMLVVVVVLVISFAISETDLASKSSFS